MSTVSTNNYTISNVELFFNSTIAQATLLSTPGGFRSSENSLGNIVSAEFTPDVTYIDHWISSAGKRIKDKTVENAVSLNISFTFDEMNITNLKRFFLGTATASIISVMQDTTDEGSAMVYANTNIGRDMEYSIPKCSIRPDGGLAMNIEDWWTGPMVLEVLEYQTADGSVSTWLDSPMGRLDMGYN